MELFNKLPLILDGAMGTELQKRGCAPGSCMEEWILENPDSLIELQRSYVRAGSDIIYAPTFGANRFALGKYGLGEKVREYNLRLVELSRKAASGKAMVAGDIAPTGEPLEPYGDMEEEELFEIYREQAGALEQAGVDLFAVETQMSGEEARVAVSAIKSVSAKSVFLSFTCNAAGVSLYGEKFIDLLKIAQEMGVSAFGINCCGDFELIGRLVLEMSAVAKIPLIVKPNAGVPKNIDGRPVFSLPPEEFSSQMARIKSLGASVLGGCCGTDARHISALFDSVIL